MILCGAIALVNLWAAGRRPELTKKWKHKVFVEVDKVGTRFALGDIGKVTEEHATETHYGGQANK